MTDIADLIDNAVDHDAVSDIAMRWRPETPGGVAADEPHGRGDEREHFVNPMPDAIEWLNRAAGEFTITAEKVSKFFKALRSVLDPVLEYLASHLPQDRPRRTQRLHRAYRVRALARRRRRR